MYYVQWHTDLITHVLMQYNIIIHFVCQMTVWMCFTSKRCHFLL